MKPLKAAERQHAEEQTHLKNGALAEVDRLKDQARLNEMTQNVRDEESEKVKILDNTANGLLQNENKLAEIGNNLNQSEPAVLAAKLKQIEADLVRKEEQIKNLQEEQEKAGSKAQKYCSEHFVLCFTIADPYNRPNTKS